MKRFLWFVIWCSALLACKKTSGTFTLEGQLIDDSFQQGLSGAVVELYTVYVGSNQLSYLATCTTGEDGKYQFSFPRTRSDKYVLKVTKSMYFQQAIDILYKDLTLEHTNVVDVHCSAKSWIKLRILNTNPNPGDHMQFIRQLGKSNCEECCEGGVQHFYGATDTILYCINDGNFPYSIEFAVYNTNNSGILSEITVPFDTTTLNLTY
ncbi:MAG: carboxypeptidase regulatory-like domain-containing protein [Bacteroidetes bacterium]|nr:carboxypeptidase regulatory-like domain-containing protein [Bacteroidota bacterium]MBM3424677.1 carboxypeptidase regulatory-like domain-containing protein [Bacteroidota bacterium]